MREVAGMMVALCLVAPVSAETAVLTPAETQAFRRQVQACWLAISNVPSITLAFQLDRSGRPKAESVRKVAHETAGVQAVEQAFTAAKRAVLRCGRDGYSLPVEKYEQWRDIELTFTPERTSLK